MTDRFNFKSDAYSELPHDVKVLLEPTLDRMREEGRSELMLAQVSNDYLQGEVHRRVSHHVIFLNETVSRSIRSMADAGAWNNLMHVARHALDAACQVLKDQVRDFERMGADPDAKFQKDMLAHLEFDLFAITAGGVTGYRAVSEKALALANSIQLNDLKREAKETGADKIDYYTWGNNCNLLGMSPEGAKNLIHAHLEERALSNEAKSAIFDMFFEGFHNGQDLEIKPINKEKQNAA